MHVFIFLLFLSIQNSLATDLRKMLSSRPFFREPRTPVIRPISYDLQLQLPLSEMTDPEIPLFTGRCALQFELNTQIGPSSSFISDSTDNRAKLKFDIFMLDHFENVSLVFNGNELEIFNVVLSDDSMEISIDQPVLFPGRYTLTIHRYKGLIGGALFYRDAGEHAVFASNLFPNRSPAVFPSFLSSTTKTTFSISIIHPLGTLAVTSAAEEGSPKGIDNNWQITSFVTTPAITPSMLCVLLLPQEYSNIQSSYTGINMTIHYNKYRIQASQAKHLLNTSTQVLAILKDMFSSLLPVPKLDIITIQDVSSTSSFGAITISETQFFSSDYANQVQMLAYWLTKQWIGGLSAISESDEMCLQEDISWYIASKVARKMTNDEYLVLGNLAKIILTETLFSPGEILKLYENPNESEISEKCGLKGVTMLESIEKLIGEKIMLLKINELVYNANKGMFSQHDLLSLLNQTVDGDIFVSQLFQYWRIHGGLPFMTVDRLGDSIKISQNQGNFTVKNGRGTWERMPLWPLPLQFTEFKLPVQIMISHGIHLSPVRDGHIFSNLGFQHFYRVNYDIDSWRDIKEVLVQNATLYTLRERFQLISDFCFFYSKKTLPEPAASVLRNEFIQLIRLRPADFPICDAAVFQCVVTHEHMKPKHLDRISMKNLRKRVFDSFTNSSEMECRSGAAHDALNDVCTKIYGVACL